MSAGDANIHWASDKKLQQHSNSRAPFGHLQVSLWSDSMADFSSILILSLSIVTLVILYSTHARSNRHAKIVSDCHCRSLAFVNKMETDTGFRDCCTVVGGVQAAKQDRANVRMHRKLPCGTQRNRHSIQQSSTMHSLFGTSKSTPHARAG